jgi:hypothetical protein
MRRRLLLLQLCAAVPSCRQWSLLLPLLQSLLLLLPLLHLHLPLLPLPG